MTKMCLTMLFSGVATISSAYAQSSQPIQAKVPFGFTVQNTMLAAGDYRMTYSNTAQTLSIYGVGGTSGGAFVAAWPESVPRASNQSPKLVFHCHDKTCFLTQVWQGNISGDRRLEVPHPEPERKLEFETRVVTMTAPAK